MYCFSAKLLNFAALVSLLVVLRECGSALGSAEVPPGVQKRFEYKLSFKGPHLVQGDGTIPFWEHFGDAIASDESVRITPSLKSKKGSVWSKDMNKNENWEIEVVFKVNGRGRIGADGLAIWYTEERGQEGPVFGSKDQWKGLGLFLDSYDNDVNSNNPYIMAMLNDGTIVYDHDQDGMNQILGGCMRDFRNKPYPTRIKIEYYNKALTIFYHNGVTSNRDDFEICTRYENVELPKAGYFGVSAATGGLADDHDVIAFLTHSFVPVSMVGTGKQVQEDEKKKFDEEFNQYKDKLDKAKEEYKKDHVPKPGDFVDEDDVFETPEARELKMILTGQNEIVISVRMLADKLDAIVGRQERQLSLLSNIQQQNGQLPQASGQQNSIQRNEVTSLLSSQKETAEHIRSVRSVLNDMQSKMLNLGKTQSGSDNGASVVQNLQDLKLTLGKLDSDMKSLAANAQTPSSVSCPSSNCVSTYTLMFFLLVQLLCIIGYMIYRSRVEAAAKKFY